MAAIKENGKVSTVQVHQSDEPLIGGRNIFPLTFFTTMDMVPDWNQYDRDAWLRIFWKQYGADMLQGVLATVVAKVATQNFMFEGPEKLCRFYHRRFTREADFDRGYTFMLQKGLIDYYTQDNGWFIERQRSSKSDKTGPCLGIAHLDSARMKPTGNAEYPYAYEDVHGEYHLMHHSQLMRFVDMPDPQQTQWDDERGFCALSRAISTAMILIQLTAMKREKLADLPPSAIAIFNNITKKQFETAFDLYGIQEGNKGNEVWRSVMPLFGIDPAHPATLDFVSFREVWESFEDKTAMDIAAYSFAVAFRIDVREFWPASQGPLGTGKEAEVQHQKAKAKSHGFIFTMLERAFNSPLTLPPEVQFRFQLQDADEEEQRANIHAIQIANIKAMQEAGAELKPWEVRHLLVSNKILPKELEKPAEEGATVPTSLANSDIYIDDVERGGKGWDWGPSIIIDANGKVEKVEQRGWWLGLSDVEHKEAYANEETGEKDRYMVPDTVPKDQWGAEGGFGQYGSSIRAAVRGLWAGHLDYFDYWDAMDSTIRLGIRRGFKEGYTETGGDPVRLSPEAQTKMQQLIQNELNFIDRFGEHIEANSKANDGQLKPLLARSDMWALTYLEARNWGKLFGNDDKLLEWRYGATKEHCTDALNLHGRVYRAKEWRETGVVPQSRDLECGGWKCGCGLFDADNKERTPGPLPKLTGQKELTLPWWYDFDNLLENEKASG